MASKYIYLAVHAGATPLPPAHSGSACNLRGAQGRAGPGRPAANQPRRQLPGMETGWDTLSRHTCHCHRAPGPVGLPLVHTPAWERGRGLFIQSLGRPSGCVQAHPGVPPRDVDTWGLGARAFSAQRGCPCTPHRRTIVAGSPPGSFPTSGRSAASTRTGRVLPLPSQRSWPSPSSTRPRVPAREAPQLAAHLGPSTPRAVCGELLPQTRSASGAGAPRPRYPAAIAGSAAPGHC
jgi:hypothetical protein